MSDFFLLSLLPAVVALKLVLWVALLVMATGELWRTMRAAYRLYRDRPRPRSHG